jgi:hypothetical protein
MIPDSRNWIAELMIELLIRFSKDDNTIHSTSLLLYNTSAYSTAQFSISIPLPPIPFPSWHPEYIPYVHGGGFDTHPTHVFSSGGPDVPGFVVTTDRGRNLPHVQYIQYESIAGIYSWGGYVSGPTDKRSLHPRGLTDLGMPLACSVSCWLRLRVQSLQ